MVHKARHLKADMRFKVFISRVQREFAAERQILAEYIRKDALLGKSQSRYWLRAGRRRDDI